MSILTCMSSQSSALRDVLLNPELVWQHLSRCDGFDASVSSCVIIIIKSSTRTKTKLPMIRAADASIATCKLCMLIDLQTPDNLLAVYRNQAAGKPRGSAKTYLNNSKL